MEKFDKICKSQACEHWFNFKIDIDLEVEDARQDFNAVESYQRAAILKQKISEYSMEVQTLIEGNICSQSGD